MIPSNGKNQFKGNFYDFWEWSAPVLQTAEEVRAAVRKMELAGRKIRDIISVGMGYDWAASVLQERLAGCALDEVSLPRCAETDEPYLIIFEDGDVLGIEFAEGSSVRMELNTLPVGIEWGINRRTFHANRLFGKVIGKRLCEVQVQATQERCFTGAYGLTLGEQENYIEKLQFIFDGENDEEAESCGLCFSVWCDYAQTELQDREGNTYTVSGEEILSVVEGYIHAKEFAGFRRQKTEKCRLFGKKHLKNTTKGV